MSPGPHFLQDELGIAAVRGQKSNITGTCRPSGRTLQPGSTAAQEFVFACPRAPRSSSALFSTPNDDVGILLDRLGAAASHPSGPQDCSRSPCIPLATMFKKASTRTLALIDDFFLFQKEKCPRLNCSASTMVVTPDCSAMRDTGGVGGEPVESGAPPWPMWTSIIRMRPGGDIEPGGVHIPTWEYLFRRHNFVFHSTATSMTRPRCSRETTAAL